MLFDRVVSLGWDFGIVSLPFKDPTPIWKDQPFPCRIKVKKVVTLTPETAVPVLDLRDRLSVFHGLKNPSAWSGPFRGSPALWKPVVGEVTEGVSSIFYVAPRRAEV